MSVSLLDAAARVDRINTISIHGKVTAVSGLVIHATLPDAKIGQMVWIRQPDRADLCAEVVGFSANTVLLMPLGDTTGVGAGCLVTTPTTGFCGMVVSCGDGLLGRIVDGLGMPMDGLGDVLGETVAWPIDRSAPDPLQRPRILHPFRTQLRAIDGLMTLGRGQRVGLFAGSGVGKSTLLGQLARQCEADVCVICLIGERGREVREFLDDALGSGLHRSVVVCATSDSPALLRQKAAHVGTAIAEYFRQQGKNVLLLMDSLTRYARALREIGLAAGEPPTRRGFPPSVFAALPRLLERTGTSAQGTITAIYTVLVEGGDMDEPVADEVRGILDGHIVLSRTLAQRQHFPAIDPLQSLSRVMPAVTSDTHRAAAASVLALIAAYEQHRDLISLGAYQHGSNPLVDKAIRHQAAIDAYLRQPDREGTPWEIALSQLQKITSA